MTVWTQHGAVQDGAEAAGQSGSLAGDTDTPLATRPSEMLHSGLRVTHGSGTHVANPRTEGGDGQHQEVTNECPMGQSFELVPVTTLEDEDDEDEDGGEEEGEE